MPQVICHCLACQRLSNSTFTTNLIVPNSAFSHEGTPKTISRPGDSGKQITLNFCPDCGHTLWVEAEAMPEVTIVKAGTVDDTSLLDGMEPGKEIYLKDKVKWAPSLAQVQKEVT